MAMSWYRERACPPSIGATKGDLEKYKVKCRIIVTEVGKEAGGAPARRARARLDVMAAHQDVAIGLKRGFE